MVRVDNNKGDENAVGLAETAVLQSEKATSRRRFPRRVVLPVLAIVVLGAVLVGYSYFAEQAKYVSTDNAMVTGALVQVGSLNAGQVSSVTVDLGERVSKNQTVAMVKIPSAVGAASGTPKMGFLGTDDQQVPVLSSIDGVVVARLSNPGDTVAAGQPLLTVVDPNQLWVQAQIEENKVAQVQPGQPVEVTVDTFGGSLPGRVTAVNQATAASFSLLPQGTSSGNFTKVTQLVAVKIAVDYGKTPLVLGSSVEVKIKVRD